MVGKVEKAIRDSGLGINPVSRTAPIIRLPIPELNEERRRELTKVAAQYAEQRPRRDPQRAPRRDGPDQEGQGRRHVARTTRRCWSDEVQALTDKAIAAVDKALEDKQAEIMQV